MSDITALTDETFDAFLTESKVPVLVDFTADWCGPCKVIGPILKKIATEQDGKVSIGKIDVDDCPKVTDRYRIQAVPTMLIFKGEEVVAQLVGALPKTEIEAELKKHLLKA